MSSRYYFLSSLPMLRFQDKAPLSWEQFLASAEGGISAADYSLLCGIAEGRTGHNAFLKKWKSFDQDLKAAVNVARKEKLGRSADGAAVTGDYSIVKYANAAINASNPLEAEMVLMQCRYEYLGSCIGYDVFSRTALLVYALQLQILIRKDLFTKESGNDEYQRLFGILQKEMKME